MLALEPVDLVVLWNDHEKKLDRKSTIFSIVVSFLVYFLV